MADWTVSPQYTQNVAVVTNGAANVALGARARYTLDLRAGKQGCWLLVAIGRRGATALAAAASWRFSSHLNDGTGSDRHPAVAYETRTAAANATTVDADSAADQNVLNVAATTGYAAGQYVCIQDADGGILRLEFGRVSSVQSGVSITLDAPLQFAHTGAQADVVTNMADLWARQWYPGGFLYEFVVDHGAAATGADLVVRARAITVEPDLAEEVE